MVLGNGIKGPLDNRLFNAMPNLTSVTIGDGITEIEGYTFSEYTKLKSVKIGKGVTTIGASAFYHCTALEKVTDGKNVKTIEEKAFSGCTKLKSFTIGSKVTFIDDNAFEGCKALKTITILSTKLKASGIGTGAFTGINAKVKVYCPAEKLDAYKTLLQKQDMPKNAQYLKNE